MKSMEIVCSDSSKLRSSALSDPIELQYPVLMLEATMVLSLEVDLVDWVLINVPEPNVDDKLRKGSPLSKSFGFMLTYQNLNHLEGATERTV